MKERISTKNFFVAFFVGATVFDVLLRHGFFRAWQDTPVILGMKGREIGVTLSGIAGCFALGFVFTAIEGSATAQTPRARLVLGFLGVVGCFVGGALANWITQAWAVILIPVGAFCLSVIPGYFIEGNVGHSERLSTTEKRTAGNVGTIGVVALFLSGAGPIILLLVSLPVPISWPVVFEGQSAIAAYVLGLACAITGLTRRGSGWLRTSYVLLALSTLPTIWYLAAPDPHNYAPPLGGADLFGSRFLMWPLWAPAWLTLGACAIGLIGSVTGLLRGWPDWWRIGVGVITFGTLPVAVWVAADSRLSQTRTPVFVALTVVLICGLAMLIRGAPRPEDPAAENGRTDSDETST
jgi:hypothetical protein